MVDRITSMAKVVVPPEIKDEFETATQWPEARFSGEVDILLGLEELALRPIRVELRGNLGIFVSPQEISCSRRTAKLQNQTDGQPISVGRQHGVLHFKDM